MEQEKLQTLYNAIDMLRALNLPIAPEQSEALATLEKEYIQENVIPTIKEVLESFCKFSYFDFVLRLSYNPQSGLNCYIDNRDSSSTRVFVDNKGGRTKYSIDGCEPLNKRQFVLAVIKSFVEYHPDVTYADLEYHFPSSLSNSSRYGVVRRFEDISKLLVSNPDLKNRFFWNPEDIIKLSDGTKIIVYNQWGDNFTRFLKVAEEYHKIDIYE